VKVFTCNNLPQKSRLATPGCIFRCFYSDCCCLLPDGSSHGVLLLNSNGMDVILNATVVTYK
jgi:hypothetical protein